MRLKGKGAMVWQLRMWKGGDPAAQAAECQALGLAWVSIKVTDGCRTQWEGGTTTNRHLLPATVAALRADGIRVYGWGWLWGNKVLWDFAKGFYVSCTPQKEAAAGVAACRLYGMDHFQVNAEAYYRGHPAWADQYCSQLNLLAPDIEYSLCTYRYPITQQSDFPTATFAPHMDAWCPQVYFLLDNRLNGGAIQLVESERQYKIIRPLPYFPIAPTYPYGYKDAAGVRQIWRASKAQLLAQFERARLDGCEAVGVWDLAQATHDQKAALEEFGIAFPPSPTNNWVVLADSNLRSGPGVSYAVIRLLHPGEVVEVTAMTLPDWWQIKVKATGEAGFIWSPQTKLRRLE